MKSLLYQRLVLPFVRQVARPVVNAVHASVVPVEVARLLVILHEVEAVAFEFGFAGLGLFVECGEVFAGGSELDVERDAEFLLPVRLEQVMNDILYFKLPLVLLAVEGEVVADEEQEVPVRLRLQVWAQDVVFELFHDGLDLLRILLFNNL